MPQQKDKEGVQVHDLKSSPLGRLAEKLRTDDQMRNLMTQAMHLAEKKNAKVNSSIAPELLIDGMAIAGSYIEAGTRSFSAYAKAMIDDFGDAIKPYLLSIYEAVRNYPGINTEGMTDANNAKREYTALLTAENQQVRQEENLAHMNSWMSQAREHWREFQPKRFRELQKSGKLGEALKYAAEQTGLEMDQFERAGFQKHEAWEMVREKYLFPPEEMPPKERKTLVNDLFREAHAIRSEMGRLDQEDENRATSVSGIPAEELHKAMKSGARTCEFGNSLYNQLKSGVISFREIIEEQGEED